MKKIWIRVMLMAALFLAAALPVQAKTILKAASYSLTNVTEAESPEGEWKEGAKGIRFLKSDGTYVKSRWISVDGSIYYMDSKGYRATGWVQYRGNLYRLRKNGRLRTGWMITGSAAYYLGADGVMATGLCKIDGAKYYFRPKTGKAATGWVTIGQYQYYFNKKNYKMRTSSWVKTSGKYYYVNAKGRKQKSRWLTVDGQKYYLDSSGARVTGTVYIKGKGYYFDKNGVYDPTVEVSGIDPSKPMVALTFDDGPGQYTNRLLNCLEANGAKATFFMVGSNVSRYASVVKRMADLGCELGNHSYTHAYMTSLSTSGIQSEVSKTNAAVKAAAGSSPTVFRLPYGAGASNSTVLSALGLPSIYWLLDTRDWAYKSDPQHTVNAVLNSVKNGDIILMHDIHYSSVVAAETIIPALIKKGYQLVTVSELAEYKGNTALKAGKTYYSF